jgi:heat shock protein HspQ
LVHQDTALISSDRQSRSVIPMSEHEAKFQLGQIVHHKLFDYIGVVFDVDPTFQGTDEWYEQVARSRPPKNEPWYHVLVNEAAHTTYVAEQNLEPASAPQKIVHPLTDRLFTEFDGERYQLRQKAS